MKRHYKALIFGSLVFASASANAAFVGFNNGDNGSASFNLVSEGITYTFSNPSADTSFSISNNELLFGKRQGANAVNMTSFKLTVSMDAILSAYSIGNNGTANGGTFSIADGSGTIVSGLDGAAPFGSKDINPDITLLASQMYTFTYSLANPSNSITGLTGLNVAPVPIPAAVWLLGSALIGLCGIRRKAVA